MNISLQNFVSTQLSFFEQHKKVAVFGAGNGGQQVIEWLHKSNIEVVRIYDNDEKKQGKQVLGIEICTPTMKIINDHPVVIASTWNKEIVKQLELLDCKHVTDASITGLSNTPLSPNWLEQLDWLTNRVADDASLNVLQNIANYLHQHGGHFPMSDYPQYIHPKSVLNKQGVIIDGGAFDGDSTIELADKLTSSAKIVAFEPDIENLKHLMKNVALREDSCRFELIEKGLWNEETVLSFNSSSLVQGAACALTAEGDIKVKVIDIDSFSAAKNYSVSMIKMDIEGAEHQALQGHSTLLSSIDPS
ncbi:FkbM family methyltransferase [Shewanella psychropiezotolerans]|uniref:FkbM family methyltransferase n=1 Tax=Shewanella psychropiezotolerans TaxID=2593655 RepID=A0ABX5WYC2_9GAMM|nr:FkbM family methyltransferase [Shewanella psychropiezotolerans]QDO83432.1 FkbM family methyltransferase [Shewanella psychropiezotolerans]